LRKDCPYYTLFLCSFQAFVLLFPCVILLIIHFDPCIPPFPRWWITSSCSTAVVISNERNINFQIAATIVSSVLTFYVLANIAATAALALLYGPLGMLFAFLSHLKHIQNKTQRRISLQPFHRTIIMYRGVQLLVGLFNDCYQWVFFTVHLFIGYFMISMALFVFVRLHAEISPEMSFLLGFFTVEGFFGMFIINSICGKIYHSSCSLLKTWSRNSSSETSRYPNRWVKKSAVSCQGIKIRMGSVNFVDRLTPFVTCGFCVRLAVRFSLAMQR
jgi:uncharacterized Tic20 family protein